MVSEDILETLEGFPHRLELRGHRLQRGFYNSGGFTIDELVKVGRNLAAEDPEFQQKYGFSGKTAPRSGPGTWDTIHRVTPDGYRWFAELEFSVREAMKFTFRSEEPIPERYLGNYGLCIPQAVLAEQHWEYADASIDFTDDQVDISLGARVRVLFPYRQGVRLDRPIEAYSDLPLTEERATDFLHRLASGLENANPE